MEDNAKNEPAKLTGAFDLFQKSKDLVMQNSKIFGILYIVPLFFVLVDMLSPDKVDEKTAEGWATSFEKLSSGATLGLVGFGLGIVILTLFISLVIQAMTIAAEVRVSKGEKPLLGDLWKDAKDYLLRLVGLAVVVGLLLVGGLLLLIVPGLIVLRRYFLSPYYLMDKNLTISEAMAQSAKESKPVSGSVWRVIGVMILISMLGIIPLIGGIAALIVGALYSLAPALRYREIKALSRSGDTVQS